MGWNWVKLRFWERFRKNWEDIVLKIMMKQSRMELGKVVAYSKMRNSLPELVWKPSVSVPFYDIVK